MLLLHKEIKFKTQIHLNKHNGKNIQCSQLSEDSSSGILAVDKRESVEYLM